MRHDSRSAQDATPAQLRRQDDYFCSAGCLAKFSADPQKYVGLAQPRRPLQRDDLHLPHASADPAVGPGSCPICGMALEQVIASAEAQPNAEIDRHDAPVFGSASFWRFRGRAGMGGH